MSDFYRWVVMRWAGHAVTDEYLTFLTIEIQGFLDDIGDEFEMVGRFPDPSKFPTLPKICHLVRPPARLLCLTSSLS